MQNNRENNPQLTDEQDPEKLRWYSKLFRYILPKKPKFLNESAAKLEAFKIEQEELSAGRKRKNWVLIIVILCVLCLYSSAIVFAFKALSALTHQSIIIFGLEFINYNPFNDINEKNLDWHILLVVSSFLIPPTILLFVTIRGVFNMSKKDGDTPASEGVQAVTDTAQGLSEVVKNGVEITTSIVPK